MNAPSLFGYLTYCLVNQFGKQNGYTLHNIPRKAGHVFVGKQTSSDKVKVFTGCQGFTML